MTLGQRILELRKSKGLSQEEVAEKLDVTRQTVSKWETDQSTPDYDKIIPICELFEITSDELLTGNKKEIIKETKEEQEKRENKEVIEKRAKGICIGILIYFVAIAWIMISIPVLRMNPVAASAIFIIICGVATFYIVYTCLVYKKEKTEEEKKQDKLIEQIQDITAIITVIIYLAVSFLTNAWHITWIIWLVYGLAEEIIKLIFMLKEEKNEK